MATLIKQLIENYGYLFDDLAGNDFIKVRAAAIIFLCVIIDVNMIMIHMHTEFNK